MCSDIFVKPQHFGAAWWGGSNFPWMELIKERVQSRVLKVIDLPQNDHARDKRAILFYVWKETVKFQALV